jgi:hypothetical protein
MAAVSQRKRYRVAPSSTCRITILMGDKPHASKKAVL